jgi:hypothetical protein
MIETGILQEQFFYVDGDLVENYNRVLERVIGKRTKLTSFHVDKRGESPEIEEELGQNYLQSGPAHRYCIVISPDQKDTGLIHEEFSFDHEILDFLYRNYFPVISLATRVDGLYGELDDDVREYETLEDLLLIKKVHLELHTPSGFLIKARRLQKYVTQLRKNPELLIKNDSALLRKILELVGEVGDVRNYNLSPIQATKELTTFFTRLFDGISVFRGFELQSSFGIKRPDQEPYLYELDDGSLVPLQDLSENQQDTFPPRGGTKGGVPPQGGISGQESRLKTVIIYQQTDYQPEDGPVVQFIPLQDKRRVIQFLVEYGYADYSYDLLDSRLSRVEDESLLAKGYEVTEMEKEQRTQVLHKYQEEMLFDWYELKDIKRRVIKGHELSKIIHDYSATVQSMLLTAVPEDRSVAYVVDHVLTKLYDFNYEKMYIHNRRHLENIYKNADENRRKYILDVLANQNSLKGR